MSARPGLFVQGNALSGGDEPLQLDQNRAQHEHAVPEAKIEGAVVLSPYSNLPARAFWRQAVAERADDDPGDLFHPRFTVSKADRIATAGSCFAQHVGRTLRQQGFAVIDAEPPPPGADPATAARFGYGLFSARYANIYTVRQLLQLINEAEGRYTPALPVWERDGRFYDAQRPGVEPEGLESPEAVMEQRAHHLAQVRKVFASADVFVFTFGLTEAWVHRDSGTVYPTAPGTIAGSYDPAVFAFRNYSYPEILADFLAVRDRLRAVNPAMRFVVTVSPVPLTATASGQHVEVATAHSKAILRAVAGELYATLDDLDYFPSYEIITSQKAGGRFYEPNLRSVTAAGVHRAMSLFMAAQGVPLLPQAEPTGMTAARSAAGLKKLGPRKGPRSPGIRSGESAAAALTREERRARRAEREARQAARLAARSGRPKKDVVPAQTEAEDVVCEEALLEAFRK